MSYISTDQEVGFRDAQRRALAYLDGGQVAHWPRKDLFQKNWLAAGRAGRSLLRRLLLRCRGDDHRESPHDFDRSTTVHEFLPYSDKVRWYIKVYFDDENDTMVVMSFHPSEGTTDEDLEGR
jgi:hypothetical protein